MKPVSRLIPVNKRLNRIPFHKSSHVRTMTEKGKTILLKDGRKVLLRTFNPLDKESLIVLYASLSPETLKWALPPYDRARIERWLSNPEQSIILVALDNDKIIGHLQISTAPFTRAKGLGELFIYLHDNYQNLGLGNAMMQESIRLAQQKGLHRIGLSVIAPNQRAIKLYEKIGFKHEGRRKEDYYGEDGHYYDVIEMGLIL